jgi:hypothetical protein
MQMKQLTNILKANMTNKKNIKYNIYFTINKVLKKLKEKGNK